MTYHSSFTLKYFSISDLKLVKIAVIFHCHTNLTYCCGLDNCPSSHCETDASVWQGKTHTHMKNIYFDLIFSHMYVHVEGVPKDGIPSRIITTIKLPLFVIYAFLSTVGIGFVIVCLIFNIVFRKRK